MLQNSKFIYLRLLDVIQVGLRLHAMQIQKTGMALAVIPMAVTAPIGLEIMGKHTKKTDTNRKAIG